MKIKFFKCIALFALLFVFITVCVKHVNANDDSKLVVPNISEMSESESIEFIKNYGIEIPEKIKNSDKLGIITKTIIEKVYNDPNCVFTYNYDKMLNYAEAIRSVIIGNYIVANSSDQTQTDRKSVV